MIYHIDDIRSGFDIDADAVVVGSGAGGAVAALNLSMAGMRVVVLEAGPQVTPKDMTRNTPMFLAKYFWEGGLRMMEGNSLHPAMQGRMLGGSTVSNSAIMFELPLWVREHWKKSHGLDFLQSRHMTDAYKRVFKRTSTTATPKSAMGYRNLAVRDALAAVGLKGKPLPRAVKNCQGVNDCLSGCAGGYKQSVDRSYITDAEKKYKAEVYTCCHVERVLTQGRAATGVEGQVVDPESFEKVAKFRVRAPLVLMGAGPTHTPVILQMSKLNIGGLVGKTLYTHIGGGAVGIMEDDMDPWVGATQGWGAFDPFFQGIKYESLWAAPSVISVKFGDMGEKFYSKMQEVRKACVIAALYRGRVYGSVKAKRDGTPKLRLTMPKKEIQYAMYGVRKASIGLLRAGARYVFTGIRRAKEEMTTEEDTDALLSSKMTGRDYSMTVNHIFGSTPMGKRADISPIDQTGKLRDVEGVYVCDASLFPSPSAVNPQATIMALSDLITRRLGDFKDSAYTA